MADRSSPTSDPKLAGTQTKTVTRIGPEEEKVLRMLHGLPAPDRLELESVAGDDPDLAARLREIELEAYRKAERVDALRREVGLEDRPESDIKTRSKIIDRLRKLTPEE